MKKKILAVITARGGSKGVPRKNIKKLGGKPLIAYTIDAAKKSKLITNLIVSTDDKEIADICRQYEANVPFMRPAELAGDKVKHLPVMRHAVEFMEEKLGEQFDYIVTLQPTAPFRLAEDIDETIQKIIDTGANSAVSLTEILGKHPMQVKKMEGDKVLPYCIPEEEGIRRQDLPIAYERSGAVYVTDRDVMMKDNKFYGDCIAGYIIPNERSIDIDDKYDWYRAEQMIEELHGKGYEF